MKNLMLTCPQSWQRLVIQLVAAGSLFGCDVAVPVASTLLFGGNFVIDDRDPDAVMAAKPKTAGLYRLPNDLVLAIPPDFHPWWTLINFSKGDKAVRMPAARSKAKSAEMLGFSFFLPDYKGYDRSNYSDPFRKDLVTVTSITPVPARDFEPNAPGRYPPNVLPRVLQTDELPYYKKEYTQLHGLNCHYPIKQATSPKFCYAQNHNFPDHIVMLDAGLEPKENWVTNPQIEAAYSTRMHGGVEIRWSTSVENIARWNEIDTQINRFISSWTIPKNAQNK